MTVSILSDLQRRMHGSVSKTPRSSNNWLKHYLVPRCRRGIHFDLTLPYHIKEVKKASLWIGLEKNSTASAFSLAAKVFEYIRTTV